MPIYEYKCNNCNYEFEKLQSIKEEALKKCPKCHKNTLRKLISGGAGLIFKGSGFYITDYKSESRKKSKELSESKGSAESKKVSSPETQKETNQSKQKKKEKEN